MIFAMLVAPGLNNFCSPAMFHVNQVVFPKQIRNPNRVSSPSAQVTQDDQVESDDAGHCIGEEGRLHNLFPGK